jgi:hypothetical protein
MHVVYNVSHTHRTCRRTREIKHSSSLMKVHPVNSELNERSPSELLKRSRAKLWDEASESTRASNIVSAYGTYGAGGVHAAPDGRSMIFIDSAL